MSVLFLLSYSYGKRNKNRTAIVILSLVFLTIVLVLEIIPYSLGMVFTRVDESNQVVNVVKYSSYFDVLPIGYALFTQFLSSLTTIACIVLFIIRIFKPYKMRGICILLSLIAGLLSILHLFMFGSEVITVQTILIASFLFSTFILNLLDFYLGK